MKRIALIFVFLGCFCIAPNAGSTKNCVETKTVPEAEISFILKTLTVYNPTVTQCDPTPLVTASNAKIDVEKLRNQQLRWMALSRNLLKRWKGNFAYGDTVRLYAGDPEIDGLWIIQDNLNKRYRDRGDLLFDRKIRRHGMWQNVKISKVLASI